MRRLACVVVLLGILIWLRVPGSRADQSITQINGYCFQGPYTTLVTCPSPSPTLVLPVPQKMLAVSAATPGPDGTSSFSALVTSKLACLPLNEPVLVYALGNPNASALIQLSPRVAAHTGQPLSVQIDQRINAPTTGTVALQLEVLNKAVGTEGLDLKAVWPDESYEQVQQVIAPATPTPTATSSVTPVTTATPTAAVSPTATAPTAATPASGTPVVPTPGAGSVLSARACVNPLVLNGATAGGDTGTLYAATAPGALCFPSIVLGSGDIITDPTYLAEVQHGAVANQNGLVGFTFAEKSISNYGLATVTCSLAGQTASTTTYFFLRQQTPPGPNPGGFCPPGPDAGTGASAQVTDLQPAPGGNDTVVGCLSVNGGPVAGVPMVAVFHYSTGNVTCSGTTDITGTASCTTSVPLGEAPGFPVVVEDFFLYKTQVYVAVAEFTPA